MRSEFIISDEQSKRLNILKLLMAIFVVYIHNDRSDIKFSTELMTLITPQWFELLKYTAALITQCAVPCFFLMSSIFLYREKFKWKDNIIKKCKSLLVPYFIMNTVWILIFALCQAIPQTAVFFTDQNNMIAEFSVFRWLQAYGIGFYPFLYPLWFVRNLFILNLLALVIKFIIDRFPRLSLTVIAALYFLLPTTNCDYLRITDLAMWCFGYFIVKYRVNLNKYDNSKWIPIVYIAIIAGVGFNNLHLAVLSNVLERFIFAIGIIFWYSCFTKNFNGAVQGLFQKFSKYNFGIYIFHEFTLRFSAKLIAKVLGTNIYIQFFECVFLPLTIVAFVVILCIVLQRIAPKTFSLLTGARVQ